MGTIEFLSGTLVRRLGAGGQPAPRPRSQIADAGVRGMQHAACGMRLSRRDSRLVSRVGRRVQLSKGASDSGSAERSANSDSIVSDQRRERCRVPPRGLWACRCVSRAVYTVVQSSFVLFMRARVLRALDLSGFKMSRASTGERAPSHKTHKHHNHTWHTHTSTRGEPTHEPRRRLT